MGRYCPRLNTVQKHKLARYALTGVNYKVDLPAKPPTKCLHQNNKTVIGNQFLCLMHK